MEEIESLEMKLDNPKLTKYLWSLNKTIYDMFSVMISYKKNNKIYESCVGLGNHNIKELKLYLNSYNKGGYQIKGYLVDRLNFHKNGATFFPYAMCEGSICHNLSGYNHKFELSNEILIPALIKLLEQVDLHMKSEE